jgi:hypothetical protein
MTIEELERRLKDAGLRLTQEDVSDMFALIAGFESLKDRVRRTELPINAEPTLVFLPSNSLHDKNV